jgi:glycosyltransferase involved in cell wall biosynthesis
MYRCYRASRGASASLATALSVHRAVGSFKNVSLFLAVSGFVRRKHLEAGFPPKRLRVKPNFAWPSLVRQGAGRYFLYLGRLSPEKGVPTLLSAWRREHGRLLVVANGPQAERLKDAGGRGVEFLDPVPPSNVPGLLREARALLVPSLGYEGAPRAVVEAYAAGVPVLASGIGALTEVVKHDLAGLHVNPGDRVAWAEAMERLLDDNESERLGEGAYRLWQEHYTPEKGLANLEAAYREAMRLWEADQTT